MQKDGAKAVPQPYVDRNRNRVIREYARGTTAIDRSDPGGGIPSLCQRAGIWPGIHLYVRLQQPRGLGVPRACGEHLSRGGDGNLLRGAHGGPRGALGAQPYREPAAAQAQQANLAHSDALFRELEGRFRLNSRPGEVQKAHYLRLDNTELSPEEAARRIHKACER